MLHTVPTTDSPPTLPSSFFYFSFLPDQFLLYILLKIKKQASQGYPSKQNIAKWDTKSFERNQGIKAGHGSQVGGGKGYK